MQSKLNNRIARSNPPTLKAMNARNEQFWVKQARSTEQLITDPTSYAAAKRDMDSETIRVSIRERKSLEQALSDAQKTVQETTAIVRRNVVDAERECRRVIARSGGLARKKDTLQKLIEKLVREVPGMSRLELWYRVKAELGRGTILAINRKNIEFRTSHGGTKSAPVSGLKDRLRRAKRK